MAEDARWQGRGRRFFRHLAWSGPLRAGGQAELKAAGRSARPSPRQVMAPRSPSPCKDTAQTTACRSRPAHGKENQPPERQPKWFHVNPGAWPLRAYQQAKTVIWKGMRMGNEAGSLPADQEKQASNSPADIQRGAIYSYYRDGMENAGGLKVKWSVRVVTCPDAAQVDARQAEVIREILQWAQRHNRLPPATT